MTLNPAGPLTGEIAFPEAEVRAALMAAAVPGCTGSVRIEFCILPEAVEGLALRVRRNLSYSASEETVRVANGIPLRKRAERVNGAMRKIQPKLMVRTAIIAIVGNFRDGELEDYRLEDVPA